MLQRNLIVSAIFIQLIVGPLGGTYCLQSGPAGCQSVATVGTPDGEGLGVEAIDGLSEPHAARAKASAAV